MPKELSSEVKILVRECEVARGALRATIVHLRRLNRKEKVDINALISVLERVRRESADTLYNLGLKRRPKPVESARVRAALAQRSTSNGAH